MYSNKEKVLNALKKHKEHFMSFAKTLAKCVSKLREKLPISKEMGPHPISFTALVEKITYIS